MKLHIENIMAIRSAELDLDGITVIVGNNNTGKSTSGKVLWAMFRALSNLATQAHDALVYECMWVLRRRFFRHPTLRSKCKIFAQQLVNKEIDIDTLIENLSKEYLDKDSLSRYAPNWSDIKNQLQDILAIDEDELQKQVVFTHFNNILGEQIVPLFKNHGVPAVTLTIKGKKLGVQFNQKLPDIETQLDLQNKSYYFDNPSVLDSLGDKGVDNLYTTQMNEFSESFLEKGSIVKDMILHKKYEAVEAKIAELLGGRVFYDAENSAFKFHGINYTDSINLRNLSQGVKSIAMLQVAFSQGAIKDKDVIIFDEPEIHLHPEWQVKLAEMIVLLQKEFNLTILLTSHSPDFVEAIRLYAKKYDVNDNLKGYISVLNSDSTVTVEQIPTDHWDKMFEKFAQSVDMLTNLRVELENLSNE